ncbi:MAG: aldo/keto reductase [Elusimicrobiales bacterium]|nr:aldo/keto reductase [Elusimicrobiales bacterium]
MGASEKIKKLALGTVQFGLAYGVSNTRGQVGQAEVLEILELARAAGVDLLDTAQAYGGSEAAIGAYLKAAPGSFRVVTKLKDVPGADATAALRASADRAGVGRFYGVLLHSYDEYLAQPGRYEGLLECRRSGLTQKTGFSLYHPEQAERLLAAKIDFDLVQVPYSLLDRRFERVFPALKAAGVEIHVRSVFLQGLLLMNAATIPEGLRRAAPKVEMIRAYAASRDWTAAAVCAGFALANPLVDRVVIGVDGLPALKDNLEGLASLPGGELPGLQAALGGLAETDENLILPQNWKK